MTGARDALLGMDAREFGAVPRLLAITRQPKGEQQRLRLPMASLGTETMHGVDTDGIGRWSNNQEHLVQGGSAGDAAGKGGAGARSPIHPDSPGKHRSFPGC